MGTEDILSLLAFLVACAAAAASGIFFRPGAWYRGLAKPNWCPPNWLFGPVWLVIYVTIALAGWMIWRSEAGPLRDTALAVYALQLVLNACWSAVFFGLRRPGLAFFEMLCLWSSIVATVLFFHAVQATAAYLLVPYLLWVSFALALNYRVWRLNPLPAAGNV
jgi:tryptophan-rich sensory protein